MDYVEPLMMDTLYEILYEHRTYQQLVPTPMPFLAAQRIQGWRHPEAVPAYRDR
jgi:hypothetical protein